MAGTTSKTRAHPLALAAQRLPRWGEGGLPLPGAGGYPEDLAGCLLSRRDADLPRPLGSTRGRSAWSRRSLWLYGIDIELLRSLLDLASPASGSSVSDISRPAVLHALFRSNEAALGEARRDRYHWSTGLSGIQATDPEVLLGPRACVRSPMTRDNAAQFPQDELPMATAVLELAMALEDA